MKDDNRFSTRLIACFIFLALLKLWLVSAQHLTAIGWAMHDDALYIKLARSLSKGRWLGEYDNLTLIKGMFYPLWIAIVYKTGMPLLLAQHVLYIVACAAFVIALKPALPQPRLLFLLWTVLLFNPMSFTDGTMTRVLREGIYPALTLLVAAGAVGIVTRHDGPKRGLFLWSILLGISFSAFWVTREEGLWILPFILILFASITFTTSRRRWLAWPKICVILVLPLCIWLAAIAIIAGINSARYGILNTVELKSSHFLNAYGALLSVRQDHPRRFVAIPRGTREHIYKNSNSFAELRPFLEGDLGNRWIEHGCRELSVCDDIASGWFLWIFRDAVAAAGYYDKDAARANEYYRRVASEIKDACGDRRLACGPMRSSLMPPWRDEYMSPLIKSISQSILYLASFKDFNPQPNPSLGPENSLKLFRKMTRESLSLPDAGGQSDDFRFKILKWIGSMYHFFVPAATILAVILCSMSTRTIFRRQNTMLWIVCIALLSAILLRLFVFSLIHVTSFPAINFQYFSPAYPLLLVFVFLSLASHVQKISGHA